jgi:hypothetical protein
MVTRTWVRLGLVALAVPQLVTGIWAVLDPSGWYDSFPGFGPDLVAADPPYNAHLATDGGAGFLCTGVVLVLAAVWGRRREVTLALVTYLAFAIPHTLFHARNSSPGLSDGENTQNVATLVIATVFPLILFWGNRTPATEVSTGDG